jgi:class 3 adenylate cyclase
MDAVAQLDQRSIIQKTKPIADLFPNATVIFGDIVGFTAWSSVREPTQVFTLLETLYGSFDKIANRLGVFKVKTIGDCYVATVGLPEPGQTMPL